MTEVFVVREIATGRYFSASTSASKAPTVYTTAGKAEGRRKKLDVQKLRYGYETDRKQWEVRRWKVEETDLPGQIELAV